MAGKRHVGVAFRGTCNTDNVVTDLKIIKTRYKEMDSAPSQHRLRSPLWGKPQVHRGFYDAWQALKTGVMQNIARALEGTTHGTLYITGHSLGGAIATLAAYDISQEYKDHRLVLYTFGSPRVGNYPFQHTFNREVMCFVSMLLTRPEFEYFLGMGPPPPPGHSPVTTKIHTGMT